MEQVENTETICLKGYSNFSPSTGSIVYVHVPITRISEMHYSAFTDHGLTNIVCFIECYEICKLISVYGFFSHSCN